MQVNKITLFTNSALKNTDKNENQQSNNMTTLKNTNAVDSFTFKGRNGLKTRFLPPELVPSANKVLEKFRELEAPVRDADRILSGTRFTEEEKRVAEDIITKGVTYEAPVEIAGKKDTVKADLGQYFNEWELCLDHGEGKDARRYRIKIDKSFDAMTARSEICEQKLEDFEFVSLKKQKAFDDAVGVIKTLLNALVAKS